MWWVPPILLQFVTIVNKEDRLKIIKLGMNIFFMQVYGLYHQSLQICMENTAHKMSSDINMWVRTYHNHRMIKRSTEENLWCVIIPCNNLYLWELFGQNVKLELKWIIDIPSCLWFRAHINASGKYIRSLLLHRTKNKCLYQTTEKTKNKR